MCRDFRTGINLKIQRIMGKFVVIKINVSAIEKEHLYKGAKGTYLDLAVRLNDEPDKYGHHGMVTQGISKELRAAGVRGAILGNAKIIGDVEQKAAAPKVEIDLSDDLPF